MSDPNASRPSGERPYDDLPRVGRHPGQIDEEPSSSVRAPAAPHPPEQDQGASPAFVLAYNRQERIYRVRPWDPAVPHDDDADYEPMGHYDRIDLIASTLPEYARFIVFENAATGEVYYDKQGNLSSGPGNGFDQITVFEDELAAAAYADARQRK